MKNSNDTIGNRTRDLPASSAVPQTTATPAACHTSNLNLHTYGNVGRDSSVGLANGYGLDGPGIECRCGARFSTSVQTGPVSHPASYEMGTRSFPGRGGKKAGAWC